MDEATKELSMAGQELCTSYQKELLPIDAIQIHKNDQGSADLNVIVTASNNKDYAVKLISDGNGYVPTTELFCYELATILDIPTPTYDLIRMRDGSLAFGSLWEGGVHHIRDFNQLSDILSGKLRVRDLSRFFSKVYAFDLFINNIDRHFGNYIFRQSYNSLIGLAFDFSRAWYEVGPYEYDSLKDKETNTQKCYQLIKDRKKYDKDVAIQTLNDIAKIDVEKIRKILQQIPEPWFQKEKKEEVLAWWQSSDKANRLTKLLGSV